MSAVLPAPPDLWTAVEVAKRFGPLPMKRLRLNPNLHLPATEQDVLALYAKEKRLYELVDGLLVEKAMGLRESCLAMVLIQHLRNYLAGRNLGTVAGEAGMMRLAPGLVRIPDVSYFSWDRLPNRQLPREPLPSLVPNLAVEVLSSSNTEQEMLRKILDYFTAGTELVWLIHPDGRTVEVYTSPEDVTVLAIGQTLSGGSLLPNFLLPLNDLFAELNPQ